jgi:hypothetical protein
LDSRDTRALTFENFSQHGMLRGWGCGSDGWLGLKYFFKANGTKRLLKGYVTAPSPVDLGGERVVDMAVGRWWSFALVL